jgi:hypothetical protein
LREIEAKAQDNKYDDSDGSNQFSEGEDLEMGHEGL